MEKWLRYKNIFNLILSELDKKDVFELRRISIEFNKIFKLYIKQKQIKFNREIRDEDLYIVEKYNILNINLDWCKNITDDGLKYLVNCKYVKLNYTWITEEGLEALYNNGKVNISRKAIYTKY